MTISSYKIVEWRHNNKEMSSLKVAVVSGKGIKTVIRWSLECGNIISTDNFTWFVLVILKEEVRRKQSIIWKREETFVLNGNYLLCETFKWPIFRLDVALASTEKDLVGKVQRSADRMRHEPVLIILACVKQRTIEFFVPDCATLSGGRMYRDEFNCYWCIHDSLPLCLQLLSLTFGQSKDMSSSYIFIKMS